MNWVKSHKVVRYEIARHRLSAVIKKFLRRAS
jgi:hypothetical protein